MVETDDTTMESKPSAATAAAMGERLRQAREAAGLSQQDVASQMRLRVTMVRALEDGQFEDIPGPPPYIRGYLRGRFAAALSPIRRTTRWSGNGEPKRLLYSCNW